MAANVLTATKNYDDGTYLTEAQLDAMKTSMESWAQDAVDNLNQIALDAYGAGVYSYDNDAAANYTNSLYNKQSGELELTAGGDVACNTTAAWTNVTGAQLLITPEITGKFKVTCQFSFLTVASAASTAMVYSFRLSDSTDNSNPIEINFTNGAGGNANDTITFPITLTHEFTSWTVVAKTVNLQYYGTTRTNATTTSVRVGTYSPVYMLAEKI